MLTVLHTNDLHNRLTDGGAETLARLKLDAGPSTLLLDAGDAIGAGNLTYRPGGEPILALMTAAGYDAMAVGNREFHVTEAGFDAKLRRAGFPVLCANLRHRRDATRLLCVPSLAVDRRGAPRVAMFGLTTPMITESMKVRHFSAYVFDDPVHVAARVVPELRRACDLLICVSHLGLERDRELARAVRGLDLIVGGHSHSVLAAGERVADTLIVQAGSHARHYGMVSARPARGGWAMSASVHDL
jgi:5'-nucleotidase